ncbi:MAG: hypothetical protein WBD07_01330 [Vicinamibacterales bacterium]
MAAHHADNGERDATVAHVPAACAAYAYSDADTVATMMTRLGLEANACVRITQTVDAMFIFSTAYLVQSRCGRVVVLAQLVHTREIPRSLLAFFAPSARRPSYPYSIADHGPHHFRSGERVPESAMPSPPVQRWNGQAPLQRACRTKTRNPVVAHGLA